MKKHLLNPDEAPMTDQRNDPMHGQPKDAQPDLGVDSRKLHLWSTLKASDGQSLPSS